MERATAAAAAAAGSSYPLGHVGPPSPRGPWRGAGQSPSVRGPRPAGQRQLVAAAWDATSGGGGGAIPPPWHRQAPRLGRVGRPKAVPAPACSWGQSSFSSLGPFSGRSWTPGQRFLFATRKQKKCSSLPMHTLAATSLLSSSSHYSCLLIRSIHLPICSPSIHHPSFLPFML